MGHDDAKHLIRDEASAYALDAMMASNACLDPERTYFYIEESGWVRVDLKEYQRRKTAIPLMRLGRQFSHPQFDIREHLNSNKTVISCKGADEKIDWVVSKSNEL